MSGKFNLFCLPFAGGSSYSYAGLKKKFPEYINVLPYELPGRGARHKEPLLESISEIVEDFHQTIEAELETPYALYGHSMGSLLGYLFTKKVIEEGKPKPKHLFFSGSGGPSNFREDPPWHQLQDDLFIERLKELGGLSMEVFQDKRLREFFIPILKADFRAIETFNFFNSDPFDIPITCMLGNEEKAALSQEIEWEKLTTLPVDLLLFSGNHFFIFEHEKEIVSYILQKIPFKCVSG